MNMERSSVPPAFVVRTLTFDEVKFVDSPLKPGRPRRLYELAVGGLS